MNNWIRVKDVILFFALALALLCMAQQAHAAAAVTISSPGSGTFIVQGVGFQGVGGVKITIDYDPATLANPRVVQGNFMPGALLAANTSSPGSVSLAMVLADPAGVSGTGTLATVSFDPVGGSPGVIRALFADLVNGRGAKLAVVTQVVNPVAPTASSPSTTPSGDAATAGSPTTGTPTAKTQGTGGSTSPVWLGGVSMPGEGGATREPTKGEPAVPAPSSEPARGESPPAAAEEAKAGAETPAGKPAADKRYLVAKSVLDRFRSFEGERTREKLVSLFEKPVMEKVSQEPRIALADGVSTVTVHVELPLTGKEAPNFALKGAKLNWLKNEGKNKWAMETLPLRGVYEATVSILMDGDYIEIPLTVAPPVQNAVKTGAAGKLTDADFERFLKEKGTAKEPRFDLNGDGKRDYVDDYIFTANYLVERESGAKGTAKPRE